jgi:hypothetical protein
MKEYFKNKHIDDRHMNIFWLSLDSREQVKLYCDAHVVKIILEITQMLYTAWRMCSYDGKLSEELLECIKNTTVPEGYRSTHKNHPMAKWIRQSIENYKKVVGIGLLLCDEYTVRYPGKDKRHACEIHLRSLKQCPPPIWKLPLRETQNLSSLAPPICVGDEKYLVRSSCPAMFCFEHDIKGNDEYINVDNTTCGCCTKIELKKPITKGWPEATSKITISCGIHFMDPDGFMGYKTKGCRIHHFDVVASYRKYYLENKMHELTRFTYTNREVPQFILDSFPRIVDKPLWYANRLVIIGGMDENSPFYKLPTEILGLIQRYVLTWPYINQKAIDARIQRQNKKRPLSVRKKKKPAGRMLRKRKRKLPV